MMNVLLSIRTKLFLVILVPAILLLFLVYHDYRNLSSLGKSAEHILAMNYNSIRAAQQIRQRLEATQNRVLMKVFQENAESLFPQIDKESQKLMEFLKENITERGEEQLIGSLFKSYSDYQEVLGLLQAREDNPLETDVVFFQFISLTGELTHCLDKLVVLNEQAMEAAEQKTKKLASQAIRYSIGLLILAFLFTVLLSFFLSSRISKPLRRLAGALADIKEGGGSYPTLPVSSKDEIGFLTREFNRVFERLKVYDRISADKLTAERQKVRQAEDAKAKFIADLSHQLKTPMTSLSMSVGLLADEEEPLSPEDRHKLLATARDDCSRLSALINELVNTARLEDMAAPRAKESLVIEMVITECLRPLKVQAEERGVILELDIEDNLPPVSIDSLRFPWVLTNLTGNAIRYTERGGKVVLSARKHGPRLYIQCRDSGSGIEEKYIPKIFDRFTQFSERGKSGTIGLGLAIVKEIIEQHGGDIRVESRVGRGTTFSFWIPIKEGVL